MSRDYYSEIHLHVVWYTKDRSTLLTPSLEPLAHRLLKERIVDTPDVLVHQIGGTETHLHLAVTVPPTLNITEWITKLKVGSAHDVNQQIGTSQEMLRWHNGYGVVSFGRSDLQWVKWYVSNQREHHGRGSLHERLERITQYDGGG